MKKITFILISIFIVYAKTSSGQIVWGGYDSRTEDRDDAGLQGNAGAKSGFFQTPNPVNYPVGATSWWHLLDVRHSNPVNNLAMQFAGSFYDQELWFRKVNNSPTQAWSKILMQNPDGNVQISIPASATVSALKIGIPYDVGNVAVPQGTTTGGYNIDFYTWRDMSPNQIGARIRAERINSYQENNALVQSMDLVFHTSDGGSQESLTEKMRIKSNGNVGIGTNSPESKLDINGNSITRGIIISSIADASIGGQIVLHNPNKTSGTASSWKIFNMSGVYGNSLQFWAYDNLECSGGLCSNRFTITDNGNVGIGIMVPTDKLAVNGNIRAKEIKVENTNWPDYVFTQAYKLPTLQETEQHIKEKGHLPGIPSAEEVKNNGVDLGEMNAKLLQKIEELTLHLIELKKENEEAKRRIEKLENK